MADAAAGRGERGARARERSSTRARGSLRGILAPRRSPVHLSRSPTAAPPLPAPRPPAPLRGSLSRLRPSLSHRLARALSPRASRSLSRPSFFLSRRALPPPARAPPLSAPLALPSRPAESAPAPRQTHGIGARPPHGPLYCRSSEPSPRRASQLRRARHGVQIVRASSCRSIGLRNARGHTQPRARFSLPVSR